MLKVSELRRICQPASKIARDPVYIRVVSRRLSIYLTALLLRLGFTANRTSILGLLVGIAAGALLALGQTPGTVVVGAALVQLSHLLDCSDGEIARYERRAVASGGTLAGTYLDRMGHVVVDSLIIFCFGVGAAPHFPGWEAGICVFAFLGAIGMMGGPNYAMADVLFDTIRRSPDSLKDPIFREIAETADGEGDNPLAPAYRSPREKVLGSAAELLIYPGVLVNVTLSVLVEWALHLVRLPRAAAWVRMTVFSVLSAVYSLNFARIYVRNFRRLDLETQRDS